MTLTCDDQQSGVSCRSPHFGPGENPHQKAAATGNILHHSWCRRWWINIYCCSIVDQSVANDLTITIRWGYRLQQWHTVHINELMGSIQTSKQTNKSKHSKRSFLWTSYMGFQLPLQTLVYCMWTRILTQLQGHSRATVQTVFITQADISSYDKE